MAKGFAIAAMLAATLCLLGCGTWGALFLWYRAPGGAVAAGLLAGLFAAGSLATLASLWLRPGPWLGLWPLAFAGLVAGFLALEPRRDRDWEPDVSRGVTATVAGDQVDVHDVRDFDWQTETDFVPRWRDERYDLAGLRTLDLINSYWTGPVIAHTLLSFGFADGRHLTFSFEIRRERGEAYSALAGFFRQYELVVIGAEDRDIVRLRTNVRGEDTQVYRLKADPTEIRALFLNILGRANAVEQNPVWYNSLTTNCTTELFGAVRAVAPALPFDWRIVLSGYLPDYVYDLKRLDTRLTLPDLRARAQISAKARTLDDDPDFATKIRSGLPDPNGP